MSQLSIAPQRRHCFVITCLGVVRAGTIIYCSASASQGGIDLAVALPLWDDQYCDLRFFNQF